MLVSSATFVNINFLVVSGQKKQFVGLYSDKSSILIPVLLSDFVIKNSLPKMVAYTQKFIWLSINDPI